MKFYYAPLEGITGYIYRNTYEKHFGMMDKYFTPFISLHAHKCMNPREKRDVAPEHNIGLNIVPQILTNQTEELKKTDDVLKTMGYEEINLNFGCPSGTVTAKHKGAGMLFDIDQMERFLDDMFEKMPDQKISIKTRLGIEDAKNEWPQILEVYNRFPIHELIIHPRVQKDFYKKQPNYEMFELALEQSKNPVCYNGNIFSVSDYNEIVTRYPDLKSIMLGRGIIANPYLRASIHDSSIQINKYKIKAFHDELVENFSAVFAGNGDQQVLFKMKELWFYMHQMFTNGQKYYKKIKKMQKLAEYHILTNKLFLEEEWIVNGAFEPKG